MKGSIRIQEGIDYLDSFKSNPIERKATYTVKDGANMFSCNPRTIVNIINSGYISRVVKVDEENTGGFYAIPHLSLVSFARLRSLWIRRPMEEVLFDDKPLITAQEIIPHLDIDISTFYYLMDSRQFGRINISSSKNPRLKPYYRFPISETRDSLVTLKSDRLGLHSKEELVAMMDAFEKG